MNKSELVAAVAQHTGESQAAVGRVIDAMFDTIGASIASGDKVTIPGYLSVSKVTVQHVRAVTHRQAQPFRLQQLTP